MEMNEMMSKYAHRIGEDFVRKYLAEEITKKEWDDDTDEIRTYFYKTFDDNIYEKTKPLVEKLFTNINGGTHSPDGELLFVSPLSLQIGDRDELSDVDTAILSALMDSGMAYSGMSQEDAERDYKRNIYYKDGKKANLTQFLTSRFDGIYISKCIFAFFKKTHPDEWPFWETLFNASIGHMFGVRDDMSSLFAPFAGYKTERYKLGDALNKCASMLEHIPETHVNFIKLLVKQISLIGDLLRGKIDDGMTYVLPKFDQIYPATHERYLIGFSYDHRWIASQSTRQGWSSCMNFMNRITRSYVDNSHFVGSGASFGSFIAYLFDKENIEADNKRPVARILFKPYFMEESIGEITGDVVDANYTPTWDDVVWVADKVYDNSGFVPAWFKEVCETIVNKAQDFNEKVGSFKIPGSDKGMYRDRAPEKIESDPDAVMRLVRKIEKDPGLFKKKSFSQQRLMLIASPQLAEIKEIGGCVLDNPVLIDMVYQTLFGDSQSLFGKTVKQHAQSLNDDELVQWIISGVSVSRAMLVSVPALQFAPPKRILSIFPELYQAFNKRFNEKDDSHVDTSTKKKDFVYAVYQTCGAESNFFDVMYPIDSVHATWIILHRLVIPGTNIIEKMFNEDSETTNTVIGNFMFSTSRSMDIVVDHVIRLMTMIYFRCPFPDSLWRFAGDNLNYNQERRDTAEKLFYAAFKTGVTTEEVHKIISRRTNSVTLPRFYDMFEEMSAKNATKNKVFSLYLKGVCDLILSKAHTHLKSEEYSMDHVDVALIHYIRDLNSGDENKIHKACKGVSELALHVARTNSIDMAMKVIDQCSLFHEKFKTYETANWLLNNITRNDYEVYKQIAGAFLFDGFINSDQPWCKQYGESHWIKLACEYIDDLVKECGRAFAWPAVATYLNTAAPRGEPKYNPFTKYLPQPWAFAPHAICARTYVIDTIPENEYKAIVSKDGDCDFMLFGYRNSSSSISTPARHWLYHESDEIDDISPPWKSMKGSVGVQAIILGTERSQYAKEIFNHWKQAADSYIKKIFKSFKEPSRIK